MNIPTCYRCPKRYGDNGKVACAKLIEKSRAVAGLGLSVIKFPCPDRAAMFSPGDVIEITLEDPHTAEWESYGGVIMRRSGVKWMAYSFRTLRSLSGQYGRFTAIPVGCRCGSARSTRRR